MKGVKIAYWFFTGLFCLHMLFTAYAQLKMPQVAHEFVKLGFPSYFRVELSWAKIVGVIVLLAPRLPAAMKEWAYAGFAITLVSAVIAHVANGEGMAAWSWAVFAGVLLVGSYVNWKKMRA